ncbi:MAG: S4 domain-containing protein [Candidatus Competibacteraceae bacterium]|nr:S4 domain-containing protein [Candidatus Competibacteraceae bacterium]
MQDQPVRLDKWLWAARFFKTRSLAAEAVQGGKVHVNEGRAKPARLVRMGDVLNIRRGPYEYIVAVQGLSNQRGPASQAVLLYEETEQSRQQREAQAQQQKLQIQPTRRPNKKERRHLIRFLNQSD